jgi:hypothetical protein
MPVILNGPRILHYRMKLAFLTRYEDAESAPKRTYKHAKLSKFFRVIPPNPRIIRGGEGWDRGEVLGRVGKRGNRCLAHPKIIPWRPLWFYSENLLVYYQSPGMQIVRISF